MTETMQSSTKNKKIPSYHNADDFLAMADGYDKIVFMQPNTKNKKIPSYRDPKTGVIRINNADDFLAMVDDYEKGER